MQPVTPEFIFTNLRIAFIAVIAYMGGAGYFSPAGVTLATALVTSLLPIAVPWAISAYMSWNVTKVPLNSVAAEVAVAQTLTSNPQALAAVAMDAARKHVAPLILIAFLALPMIGCATRPGKPSTVEIVQGYAKAVCAFVPTAETIDAIFKTGLTDEIAMGKAICASIAPTNRQTFLPSVPTVRGVPVVGRYLK